MTTRTIATITTSVDGYVTGPDDGPEHGLGIGGERLHYWVMGGPWTYETEHETGSMTGEDKTAYEELLEGIGAALVGRSMYDAAGAWGGRNPFQVPLVVLTHRTEEQPAEDAGFHFVSGFQEALAWARQLAGGQGVTIGGGADTVRQALAAGVVDELALTTAPVVLGAGKRLFQGFDRGLDLEKVSVHSSPYATHVRYRVIR